MSADTIMLEDHEVLARYPTGYPTEGVRVGINHHQQTLGGHRARFAFDHRVVEVLRRGLSYPRIQIDGSFVNGLRVWCAEADGMAPSLSKTGGWHFSVPVRRVRGREAHVTTTDVDFEWERDDTGPVLIIPRLPDAMLPEKVVDMLPNSQVDPETRFERAEKRLAREMGRMNGHAPADPEPEPPEPEPIPVPEPTCAEADLREAIGMVNELIDRLGDAVVLSLDERGHVHAKRRIVQFVDL